MKELGLFIWQLPQNICGWAMIKFHQIFCKHELRSVTNSDGITYYVAKHVNNCGVSLGKYIILDTDSSLSEKNVKHEQGHRLQSLRLGWLYLPTIGLCSAIGNILHRFIKFDYYKQPWEKWADKLGGVVR